MAKNEQLRKIFREYEKTHDHLPATAREAVVWGVREGLAELPKMDPYDALADQMARALREEYKTDSEGRRYRVNHAVRVSKAGVQHTFWAIMGFAQRGHMEKAFVQRREQIVGDCVQLQTDIDVYNGMNPKEEPMQTVLDFRDDVAERQAWLFEEKKAA